MNKALKKIALVLLGFMLLNTALYSQDAVTKALDLINKNLILNDYEKAYSYSKFVINYYDGEEFPEDALNSVCSAITQRGNVLVANENWDAITEMYQELSNSPSRVKSAAKTSYDKAQAHYAQVEAEKEKERLEKEKQAEEEKKMIEALKVKEADNKAKAERDAESKKLMDFYEQQRKLELEKEELRQKETLLNNEKQMQLEESRQQADLAYRQELTEMMREINQTNTQAISNVSSNNKVIMIIFSVIIFVFVIVIIGVIIINYKQNKNQQEQMHNTILTMQAMRVASPVQFALPLNLQMETMALDGTKPSTKLLADNSGAEDATIINDPNDQNQEELKNLLKACKQYGEQIDIATGRKNVTTRVAELVYKISVNLGFSETESMLYYAASLVYDIGFLSIDPTILASETISEQQFEILKTHTSIGPNMVFFVEEKYRNIFKDACAKHHENLDGTGYPKGLKADQIPYIARVLRVVESYIALISSRQYRNIRDRDSAIQELRNCAKQYDEQIVDALDAIV